MVCDKDERSQAWTVYFTGGHMALGCAGVTNYVEAVHYLNEDRRMNNKQVEARQKACSNLHDFFFFTL